jgi:prepilin-type N-terminal cleavage/methylation domain-containing protein
MKNKKGFTLVELVIVIVIVGILSIISVPIYRGYVEKAMMTEGKVLLNAIGKAELAYHVKYGTFKETNGTKVAYDDELDISAEANKYFSAFDVKGFSFGRAAKAVNKKEYSDPVYDLALITVYGSNRGQNWELRAVQAFNGGLYGLGPDYEIVEKSREVIPIMDTPIEEEHYGEDGEAC